MSAGPVADGMCAATVFVAGSMRTTSAAWSPATQTDPAPVHTLYAPVVPTSMRALTRFVPGSIRSSVPDREPSSAQTAPNPVVTRDQARAAQPDARRRVEPQQHAEALARDPGRAEVESERLGRPERPGRARRSHARRSREDASRDERRGGRSRRPAARTVIRYAQAPPRGSREAERVACHAGPVDRR